MLRLRCASVCYTGFFKPVFGRMAMGNSPFGAWVVCVYRVEASLEPRVGKCNDLRPFLYSYKIVRIPAEQG